MPSLLFTASGQRIFLKNIPGVGTLRTRFPVMPVYGEFSSVWKEVDALKEIVTRMSSRRSYLFQKPVFQADLQGSKSFIL